jgi:Uma2 family endonuclease
VEYLYNVPENGKAELVNGELVRFTAAGIRPAKAGGRIYSSLERHEDEYGGGYAVPDNAGFLVSLPDRESFSPDVAWMAGEEPENLRFENGAPTFAVEVRSENDYGPAMERAIEDKIADYFAAGTLVVWDVDLISEDVIKSYRFDSAQPPLVFRRDEIADAEPAVSGWRFLVNNLFSSSRRRAAGNG